MLRDQIVAGIVDGGLSRAQVRIACRWCGGSHVWPSMSWVGIQVMGEDVLELRNDPHGSTRARPISAPRIIDVEVLSVEVSP